MHDLLEIFDLQGCCGMPARDHKELEQKEIGDEWADTLRDAPRPPM